MTILLMFLFLNSFISLLLALIASLIGKKNNNDQEKLTPFECGFDPLKKARVPFSLRFFLLTVIFLIFDVEIVILLPLGLITYSTSLNSFYFFALIITLILILGLAHEWNQGALNWI